MERIGHVFADRIKIIIYKKYLILLAVLLLIPGVVSRAEDFHVSPNGDDANSGTREKPFATLEKARDAIRQLKKAGQIKGPISVTVAAGTYRMDTGMIFETEDSGTDKSPIVWQAAPGGIVRLCGGPFISPDAFVPVTDEKVLGRLDPSARGKVKQANLHGVVPKGLAKYPDHFRGAPTVPELFFNDQRMTVARWPNEGWTTITRIVDGGTLNQVSKLPYKPGIFEYDGNRPARWKSAHGVWLHGFWAFDWYDETIKIQTIDDEKHQIELAQAATYGVRMGNASPRRFRALNLLEELDEPGEYYLDVTTSLLYFWPPAELFGARIELSTLTVPLVSLKEVTHLTLRGFTVEAGLGDGIVVTGGIGNHIEKCEVCNMRLMGIRVDGGTSHRIEGCDIHDTGTGGLLLEGGDRKTLTPGGHVAENNHIWRFSQHQLTYAGGIVLSGVGNRASHNMLHDAPHLAVSILGNDHIFEYNLVYDICTASDDSGALYKGRNPSCRGNLIRFNFWRDIGSRMGHGTAAIYFDDGDGGDIVSGNVFLRCGNSGKGVFGTIFCNGGFDSTAENNIFIECERALGSAPWDYKHLKEMSNGELFQTQLLKDVDITKPPYSRRYPGLAGFMDIKPDQLRENYAKNNLLVRCGSATSGNWKVNSNEIWMTDQNPGFVNAAQGDYRLRPDAEVFKHLPAFKPIPIEQIGVYKSPLRLNWPIELPLPLNGKPASLEYK